MKDNEIIICRCQELTRADVLRAIEEGAATVDGVKKRIKSGMGLCQGKTCERLVMQILAEKTGKSPSELMPATQRAPVRAVPCKCFLD